MSSGVLWETFQGVDFEQTITVVEADGTPRDLTGSTVRAYGRVTADDAAVAFQFDPDLTDAATGTIRLRLSAATLTALAPKRYVFNVLVDAVSGLTSQLIKDASLQHMYSPTR